MADHRFFPNDMPDYLEEPNKEGGASATSSLLSLLRLPYPDLTDRLLSAALHLKDKVVNETWIRPGRRERDYTLPTGSLGTAFLLFKAYQVTGDRGELALCAEIVRACDGASIGSPYITFISSRAAVCALGAVAAKYAGDEAMLDHYLDSFRKAGNKRDQLLAGEMIKMATDVPNELLYGRAGYLLASFFINKHIGDGTVPLPHISAVARDIFIDWKRIFIDWERLAGGSCPLMYEWYGIKYWGAAHGLAGIMDVLMEANLNTEEQELVKGTLLYMIQNRFQSGNYLATEGFDSDNLVHWCHGSLSVSRTLTKAAKVFNDGRFLQAALEEAEVVWKRGLIKRVGLCNGVSKNAYVFLTLYRHTGNIEHLYRARAFACFLLDRANQLITEGKMHAGDHPYSLFEGQAGMAYLFLDMSRPLVELSGI